MLANARVDKAARSFGYHGATRAARRSRDSLCSAPARAEEPAGDLNASSWSSSQTRRRVSVGAQPKSVA
jgi:hypothetical protein